MNIFEWTHRLIRAFCILTGDHLIGNVEQHDDLIQDRLTNSTRASSSVSLPLCHIHTPCPPSGSLGQVVFPVLSVHERSVGGQTECAYHMQVVRSHSSDISLRFKLSDQNSHPLTIHVRSLCTLDALGVWYSKTRVVYIVQLFVHNDNKLFTTLEGVLASPLCFVTFNKERRIKLFCVGVLANMHFI